MPILVTGFEPFGGALVNPSWEAVSLLPDSIGGQALMKLRLPVCYSLAAEKMLDCVRQERPSLVMCVGLAGGRKAITPELVALNYRLASIPDNAGVLYSGERIDPDAPDAHMSPLPVTQMVSRLRDENLPASLSLSAGAYVCNDLYFALLHRGQVPGVFVHVPDAEVLSAQEAARGLRICLETALASLE